ncbi:MAG: hypothetical protein HW375_1754, partial [Anaerolineales bacterium]|nr:hypothetical protein [Anaerolineales bacterium]
MQACRKDTIYRAGMKSSILPTIR